MKKVGKTIRPFRYDLNQIPYDYIVEVTNRFKGLDLINRVPEELWMVVHDCAGNIYQDHTQSKKKCKKAKWLSEEALCLTEKRREDKGKGEKERYMHQKAEFQGIARRGKIKTFSMISAKKITDVYCSHEIKRHLLLGRKVMSNLDSILKSRDITLPTKVCLVKAIVFPIVMYGCENWTIKKMSAKVLMLLNCGVGEDS